MIDHDNDGFIEAEDLKDMLCSLGYQNNNDDIVQQMLSDASGPINFTMFLTLFGGKMIGTDPEHEILKAFEAFDEKGTGLINGEEFREFLTTMGDRFTDDEVRRKKEIRRILQLGLRPGFIWLLNRSTSCSKALRSTRTASSTTESLSEFSSTESEE